MSHPEWLMTVDDGPFAGLEFTIPGSIIGPNMVIQIIKGDVKMDHTLMSINHQAATVEMEKV